MPYIKHVTITFEGDGLFVAGGPVSILPGTKQLESVAVELGDGVFWRYPAATLERLSFSHERGRLPQLRWVVDDYGWTVEG